MITLKTKSVFGLVTGLVIALTLVAGANVASAFTAAELDILASIGVSADKIAALKVAQYASLSKGSRGAEVTALQQMLVAGGFLKMPAGIAYGYYGDLTVTAYAAYKASLTTTTTGGSTSTSGSLEGGAGDLTINDTNTGVKNSLKEGEENVKVLGLTVDADGSDISVNSIKVTLENASSTDGTSEKLSNYLDSVTVYMGSTKVGSADVSDFTKNSDTPDYFTKTINLDKAVIPEGDDAKIYVAVSAVSNIDTEDMAADLKLTVNTVRFSDATGAILTGDLDSVAAQEFSFDDVSTDDKIDAKSSSSNPDSETVLVEENNTSDEYLALVFKLDVDNDSSDVMITSIPVTLTLAGAGATADSIENVVDTVTLTIDGNDYEADLTTDNVENGSSTAVYTVDFDTDEVVVDSGDVVDVKVSLKFNEQQDNYTDATTKVTASVNPASIDAETSSDDITVGGSTKTGAELTLSLSAASLSGYRWSVPSTGTIIDYYFTVSADEEDVDVLSTSIASTTSGTATTSVGVLTFSTGDSVDAISNGFTVAAGDTATFRVRYTVSGNNGQWAEVKITSLVGNVVPDDKQISPTATINI